VSAAGFAGQAVAAQDADERYGLAQAAPPLWPGAGRQVGQFQPQQVERIELVYPGQAFESDFQVVGRDHRRPGFCPGGNKRKTAGHECYQAQDQQAREPAGRETWSGFFTHGDLL